MSYKGFENSPKDAKCGLLIYMKKHMREMSMYNFESSFVCPAFLQFWCNVINCKSAYKNEFHCYLRSLFA